MCHSWVKRIIRADTKKEIRFSPLEGKLAAEILTPLLPDYMQENTIVFFDEGEVFIRSEAALKILQALGFPFNLGLAGYLMPKKWRDGIYRYIANRRYKYGERYDVCPMPPPEWRERFVWESERVRTWERETWDVILCDTRYIKDGFKGNEVERNLTFLINFQNSKGTCFQDQNKFLCKVCHPLGYKGHKTNVSGLTLIRIVFNKKE